MVIKTSDALYATKDGGAHWDRLEFPLPMGDINALAVPPDPGAPLLVATRVGLYSSPDGSKWTSSATGLQASTVSAVTYQGSAHTAYAVEYGELFKSDDAGANWTQLPTRLHSLGIRQLWVSDTQSSRLYAITSGLGVLFRD
jgi:photosystem II stability/assembly factor-like uncharacterized protein